MTTPHDAEEAMRPYLGRLHDARETMRAYPLDQFHVGAYQATLEVTLGKALDLLGVQR